MGTPHCMLPKYPCEPLTNLQLCQNLEEFRGSLHSHDLKTLSELPNLKKLKLKRLEGRKALEYLLNHMNLSKLKHFYLKSNCDELARHHFPALERLCLTSAYMADESLEELIKNCPSLKSIQFPNGIYHNTISNEVLCKIFKDKDIFIIFDAVIHKNNWESTQQKSFEDYLIENDLIAFRKYNRMKKDFLKWCKNNIGYGY